jgi:hypothetical protein
MRYGYTDLSLNPSPFSPLSKSLTQGEGLLNFQQSLTPEEEVLG